MVKVITGLVATGLVASISWAAWSNHQRELHEAKQARKAFDSLKLEAVYTAPREIWVQNKSDYTLRFSVGVDYVQLSKPKGFEGKGSHSLADPLTVLPRSKRAVDLQYVEEVVRGYGNGLKQKITLYGIDATKNGQTVRFEKRPEQRVWANLPSPKKFRGSIWHKY